MTLEKTKSTQIPFYSMWSMQHSTIHTENDSKKANNILVLQKNLP